MRRCAMGIFVKLKPESPGGLNSVTIERVSDAEHLHNIEDILQLKFQLICSMSLTMKLQRGIGATEISTAPGIFVEHWHQLAWG